MRTAIIIIICLYPVFMVYTWFFYQPESLITYTLYTDKKQQVTVFKDSYIYQGGLYIRTYNRPFYNNIHAYYKPL